MIKKTKDLIPGDIVHYHGERVQIEMTSPLELGSGTMHLRWTNNGGWFKPDAQWLVDEPLDDVIRQAEAIALAENGD